MKQLKKAQEKNNAEQSTSDTDTDSVISTSTVAAETAGIGTEEEGSKNKSEDTLVVKKKEISLRKFLKRKRECYGPNSKRKRVLDIALTKLIVQDFQPISIVEDKGFTQFVHLLDERYALPSRRHITDSLIPSMYEAAQKKLAIILSEVR